MRILWLLSRVVSKPATLWCLFAIILVLAGGGLALLSRHALELRQQQWVSEQREDLQQDVRVALWRLDSRLGPYIATLHDPIVLDTFPDAQGPDEFVIERFLIRRNHKPGGPKSGQVEFVPWPPLGDTGASGRSQDNNWQQLVDSIPVEAVVAEVDELIPQIKFDPSQSLIQGYGGKTDASDEFSQRELGNRTMIVQQQVAMNVAPAEFKGGKAKNQESSAEENDTKLMSVWIDDHLVVVRSGRTSVDELEGVWVHWQSLRQSLIDDLADLIPGASIQPVKRTDTIDPSRTLAAIPAMVIPLSEHKIAPAWSPTHTALLFAWCALILSALIAAVALGRLIALSERRAAFVSAVTHELRTPLTTFRLYSDLLARNMVSDPSDRKEYLQTLRREADRLTHLVDNVLRYSKLQRTSKRAALETVVLSEWVDRIAPRLEAHLAMANMTLVIDQKSDCRWSTDPPAMEQAVFNLVDNAAKYAQSATDRRVHLGVEIQNESVVLTVFDHGPGVPKSLRSTIFRPFAKSAERAAQTAAGVGLGLALVKQTAIALGGKLTYRQIDGGGATFQIEVPI